MGAHWLSSIRTQSRAGIGGVNTVGQVCFRVYGTGNDWKPFCAALAQLPPGDDGALRRLIEAELQPVAVIGEGKAEGLFTGHPDMPEFVFEAPDVGAILAYLESIQER